MYQTQRRIILIIKAACNEKPSLLSEATENKERTQRLAPSLKLLSSAQRLRFSEEKTCPPPAKCKELASTLDMR